MKSYQDQVYGVIAQLQRTWPTAHGWNIEDHGTSVLDVNGTLLGTISTLELAKLYRNTDEEN